MADGSLRRFFRFHRDAVMSGGKKGVALAGGVSLVLGGSVGALTVWLANVSWVIAALVAMASFFVFYAWGAYRVWDGTDRRTQDADRRRQPAEADLEAERAKPAAPVHSPTFWDIKGGTVAGEITNTYNAPREGAGGGRLVAMGPGTGISGEVNVEYGSGQPPAFPDPLPSTPDECTGLRDQLLAVADQVDAVMASFGQSRQAIAAQMGIAPEEFTPRMPEILAERSRIDAGVTARYNSECRSTVIQVYGHARSIGLTDAEMERLWRTRIAAGARGIPVILRRLAARIPD